MDGWRALAIKVFLRAMQDAAGMSLYMRGDARTKYIKGAYMTREDIMADGEAWLRDSKDCDFVLGALGYPWARYAGGDWADFALDPAFDWCLVNHRASVLV